MKTIAITVSCLLIAGTTFSQFSKGGITSKGSTQSSTNVQHSSPNVSFSTNNYSSSNSNSNYSYSNTNKGSDNNSWSSFNTNSNDNRPNTNNNNSYSNNNYNNSNYNNNNYNNSSNYNYGNNYGGYNSYNNSTYNNTNYSTYEKQAYTTRDENYGERTISEDQGKLSPKSNPYNTTKMMSNYRNHTAIQKFFKQNQKPSQVFIINAQQDNTVKGTGGTIVKIDANSFVDKNGEVVKGDVEFEMKEMYSKSDMILSNAHTVCNDQVLKSGGEVFVGASRNGEPLILANDKAIAVEFPTSGITKEPMQLFNGKPNDNSVNWDLAGPTEVTPVANSNSSTGYSYNFTSSNMNWLNCDQFTRNNPNNNGYIMPATKVNVRLLSQYDSTNTAVFLVYNGQKSVTRLDGFSKYDGTNRMQIDQNTFDTKWYSVQEGSDVTIVAISEINGQYYSSMESTKIQRNHTTNLIMTPTTLDQIKTDMENLR